ncbi:MAG: SIS domain-containing protein [Clostridia bacterium]|nr:SIS domain-containing protein [Clostridia bacterium]
METLSELIKRYPLLNSCESEIQRSAEMLIKTYKNGNRLYICGNGGSAADADHIVGELMKGFLKKRPLTDDQLASFGAGDKNLAKGLMQGLPAVSLHSQTAFLTAFLNDEDPSLLYAQALYALGKKDDILLAISTSGNSQNVVNAAKVAHAIGCKVISLVGAKECKLDTLSDIIIHTDSTETYRIQELHLPIYHYLCTAIEDYFFKE